MDNYVFLNGVIYDLVARETAGIATTADGTKLSEIPEGDTFKIGKYEFVVLEHSKETTAVILKGLLIEKKQFGNNNNFAGSYVDKECQKLGDEIADIVGSENLVEHTVDLTSDNGLKDYGKARRKISLLTAELYRRYVYILDKFKPEKWWWLATAYSTKTHGDVSWVKCVSPSGDICYYSYDYYYGVRPFCILNSSIFVSK